MLNKKILATAIAGTFVSGMAGAFNIDTVVGPTDPANLYAAEVIAQTTATTANLEDGTDSDLVIENRLGFSIGEGTTKYVRYDLTGAVFSQLVDSGDLSVGTSGTVLVANGGLAGSTFVIFEVEGGVGTGGVDQNEVISFTADGASDTGVLYEVDLAAGSAAIKYSLYETALDALSNDPADRLSETGTVTFAEIENVKNGSFTTADNLTGSVASDFLNYIADPSNGSDGFLTATTGTLGAFNTDDLITTSLGRQALNVDGTPVDAADIIVGDTQSVVLTGNQFGTFRLTDDAACTSVVSTFVDNNDGTAIAAAVNVVNGALYVCSEVDGTSDLIQKGSYSVTLATDGLTGALGTVGYDTTSVEIPYITTFADYNQRFYIQNLSSQPVEFSVTYKTEAGNTATDILGTGVAQPGVVTMVKATDMVSFSGATRGAGTFEFEADTTAIRVTTQIVDNAGGGTDTLVLKD